MDGFKEYIRNFVKYPAIAKTEIVVRKNFNAVINKYTKENCILLTTKLTIEQIYKEIQGVYKDTSIIYLTQVGAILTIKIKKSFFKRKQEEYLYIAIKKYEENEYFVVCEYSIDDINIWNETIAQTTRFPNKELLLPIIPKTLLPTIPKPHPLPAQPATLYKRLLQRVIPANPKPKPKRTAPYMMPSNYGELSPLIPKQKPKPKPNPKPKSKSKSKSSSSHSSIELLLTDNSRSTSSSSRKVKK